MQAHERISIEPVTARCMSAVDHDYMDCGVVNQRVDKSHRSSARTHH